MKTSDIGVIGAGAWGTALAQMLASDGRDVTLWARSGDLAENINVAHANEDYLPSVALAPTIRATADLDDMRGCDTLLMVTPAQALGSVLTQLAYAPRDLILCSKGIEAGTHRMMNEVARDIARGSEIAVLSGPTFAHEVARGLPTAVTLACGGGEEQWDRLSPLIARTNFRPYYSADLTGAEIGGSVKNVLAIACGVVDGLALGQNAGAALIARGYAEMMRIGEALGAERDTLAGLCGMGDLVLTCSSTASRNFSLGKALGQGQSADSLLADRRTVAEGAYTAPVLRDLARKKGIAMPITEAVCALLDGDDAAMIGATLLARPLKAEGPDA
ncbi:NAD(P)H-dependent glycerol-3-phosphate dehydrogenase [Altericroceibacterium endophyticum]|uniref:Glycerol-3-phosphate dehydrogenase [NAD(P)+] n=1 Tax=Altericroceibacterium endophyticum TaxID=1808508 RepID=A0A6I4T506_9SPHN|nr:NAD(P)H-dependent glycerol-3-phosphate dehydrogenase [Altericroceibacterium endophyticum]MXO64990.1 NAD(P)H-dependent glycerol-3-phosphate dehydrogenase [Altericroceibacterium endophyticum]